MPYVFESQKYNCIVIFAETLQEFDIHLPWFTLGMAPMPSKQINIVSFDDFLCLTANCFTTARYSNILHTFSPLLLPKCVYECVWVCVCVVCVYVQPLQSLLFPEMMSETYVSIQLNGVVLRTLNIKLLQSSVICFWIYYISSPYWQNSGNTILERKWLMIHDPGQW